MRQTLHTTHQALATATKSKMLTIPFMASTEKNKREKDDKQTSVIEALFVIMFFGQTRVFIVQCLSAFFVLFIGTVKTIAHEESSHDRKKNERQVHGLLLKIK